MLIGIVIGMFLAATFYGILLLLSLKKSERKFGTPQEIDQELIETINLIKKDYVNITSGFSPSEKLKVLGNTIMNTMKTVAQKYYPDSKYPIYELNINELVILAHYITNRIDELFDKNILKYLKNVSISQILKLLDVKKKVEQNKAVKAVKKVNPVVKVISGIVNYANPIYWIKKGTKDFSISSLLQFLIKCLFEVVGKETANIYNESFKNF
jgi:hypothetical protein